MPYTVRKDESCPASKPYAVVKKTDGEVLGCHKSEKQAKAQMVAIQMNENEGGGSSG